ncbi:MAG: hypothetical protein PHY64_01285 [Eubacteriales bacterium]|nr:hypothetical protein [Eubacteriales bacterium]
MDKRNQSKVQFARTFYSFFQFNVPPPPEMLPQCKALRKRCTSRRLLAVYIISLCKDTDELEGLALICEACDWAGADMAKETIFWTGKILPVMDGVGDVDEDTNANRHAVIYSFRGKALALEKRAGEARDAFEAAYRYRDTYENLCRLVDSLISEQRFDDALDLLEEARQRHVSGEAAPLPQLYPGRPTARQRSKMMLYVRNVLNQIDIKMDEITALQAEAGKK